MFRCVTKAASASASEIGLRRSLQTYFSVCRAKDKPLAFKAKTLRPQGQDFGPARPRRQGQTVGFKAKATHRCWYVSLLYNVLLRLSSSARCQSARGSSSDGLGVDRKAVEEERHSAREENDAAFSAWLRQKQREAAERHRRQRQNNRPVNEVHASFIIITISIVIVIISVNRFISGWKLTIS